MNKSTSNYKMSKPLKARLALSKFRDEHDRGGFKRAMIDAEIEVNKKPKLGKEDKE